MNKFNGINRTERARPTDDTDGHDAFTAGPEAIEPDGAEPHAGVAEPLAAQIGQDAAAGQEARTDADADIEIEQDGTLSGLTIDPEFQSLITPLSADERDELERSILHEGCRDAIVTWQGVIIDGHNRYAICTQHGVPFQTVERAFPDRAAVKEWIIRNQFARRNLSNYDRSRLALQLKALVAARAKANQGTRTDIRQNSDESSPISTKHELAAVAGVSHDTIHKVEVIERDAPEAIKEKLRAGALSTHRAYLLTKALKDADADIVDAVARLDIDEPETVDILKRLKKSHEREGSSDTFSEILLSGFIQPGEEHEAVHITEGPLRIAEALRLKSQIHRQLRNDAIRRNSPPLPEGVYDLIYADPPWQYEHPISDSRAIENQYPTMTTDEICALPVGDRAADDCVLLLWATNPKLPDALRVIEAWGFTYRTNFVWVKDKIGMGYYARQRHELLLVAVRGTPGTPDPSARPDSVIEAPRGAHSAKPHRVYAMIERMYPHARRLELFARNTRDGWAGWGAEYAPHEDGGAAQE